MRDECKDDERKQDKFWLLIFEHATKADEIPDKQEFLRRLKDKNVTFMDFNLRHENDDDDTIW